MTKEELAAKLTGRQYGDEISDAEEREAKAAGLVVIFGYSDDNAELRGAIHDEIGTWEGAHIKLHSRGALEAHEDCDCDFCGYKSIAEKCGVIEAPWCKEPGYSWTYKTALPHATFEIMEDGEHCCRGIVLEISSLPSLTL